MFFQSDFSFGDVSTSTGDLDDADNDDPDLLSAPTRPSLASRASMSERMGEIRVKMKEVSLNSYSDGRLLSKVGRAIDEEMGKRGVRLDAAVAKVK